MLRAGKLQRRRRLEAPGDLGGFPVIEAMQRSGATHLFVRVVPHAATAEISQGAAISATTDGRGGFTDRELAEEANRDANPELFRLALKLATGAGKTTVMAMLIAWQAANAARQPGSSLFSRGFLLIAPGITIRDRLRVLLPSDPENYYKTRELVPVDLLPELGKAKVVIANYHVFQRREILDTNKTGRAVLAGWRTAIASGRTVMSRRP